MVNMIKEIWDWIVVVCKSFKMAFGVSVKKYGFFGTVIGFILLPVTLPLMFISKTVRYDMYDVQIKKYDEYPFDTEFFDAIYKDMKDNYGGSFEAYWLDN